MQLSAAEFALARERDEAEVLREAAALGETNQIEQESLVLKLQHMLASVKDELTQQQQRHMAQEGCALSLLTSILADIEVLLADATDTSSLLAVQHRLQVQTKQEAQQMEQVAARREEGLREELLRLERVVGDGERARCAHAYTHIHTNTPARAHTHTHTHTHTNTHAGTHTYTKGSRVLLPVCV